jgi:hypothetical protein
VERRALPSSPHHTRSRAKPPSLSPFQVKEGTIELSLAYLKTYENVGSARVECISGCRCAPLVLSGLWELKYSQPFFQRIPVTAHPECKIKVRVV